MGLVELIEIHLFIPLNGFKAIYYISNKTKDKEAPTLTINDTKKEPPKPRNPQSQGRTLKV